MKTKNKRISARLLKVFLLFLLCGGVLAACGKDKAKKNGSDAATPTVTTVPATTTPSPTPTIAFVKQAYETVGRDNVYRLPIVTPSEETSCYCEDVAGDYALFSISKSVPSTDGQETSLKNSLVLAKPLVSSEIKTLEPDFLTGYTMLFADGSVLLEDIDAHELRLYDNTLTEVRSYALDDSVFLGRCLGITDGKWCFTATSVDRDTTYLYVPKDGGEAAFGPEPSATDTTGISARYSYPYGWDYMMDSSLPATWNFHEMSDARKGIAFPKSRLREVTACLWGAKLCGRGTISVDDETENNEYRLYDLEKRTVSEVLAESDFPEKLKLRADGVIGDGVIFCAAKADGSTEVFLWIPEKSSPVAGFCDFQTEDPTACLTQVLKAASMLGIDITPDAIEDDGTAESFSEIVQEIEFVDRFIVAVAEQPELAPKDGERIHPENMRNNAGGHYEFKPHVMSKFYREEHGEARRQALFNYVDALRAGEDWFECPDIDTLGWCVGRLGHFFYPVGSEFTSMGDFKDGKGEIIYNIPKEEYMQKQREFEDKIMTIVNNACGDDYNDVEKCIALYEFLTEYCTYDYEMLAHCTEWMERQGGYRALIEKTGICNEFACLYQYLLLQVGVDVEESAGDSLTAGDDSHAWVYVTIDGKGYLIDPTWGETDSREPKLAYFLFTDEERKTRDGFNPLKFYVAGAENSRKKYSFEATDETFKPLWNGTYVALDHDARCIYYFDYYGELKRFEYGKTGE